MAVCEIDIRKITGSTETVGVYKPAEDETLKPYGIVENWALFAECPMWVTDISTSSYGSDDGIGSDTTMTVYIGGKGRNPVTKDGKPLPSRVGLRFEEGTRTITPSVSVENFYDFDGSYVYSLVVI